MTKSIRIKRAVAGIGLGLAGSVGGFVLAGVPAANAATSGHNGYICPAAPEPTVTYSKTAAEQYTDEFPLDPCYNATTGKFL